MGGGRDFWWEHPLGVALWGRVEPLLQRADHACRRFEDGNDGEPLHDLRVAFRRLRALLHAYEPYLPQLGNKLPSRLRALMRRTNSARDSEVILAWIGAQRPRLSEVERDGSEWLLDYWNRRYEYSCEELRQEIPRCWIKLRTKLRVRMEHIASSAHAMDPSYRQVTALVFRDCCDDLERRVKEVAGGSDIRSVHSMRIAAKRLRYLLEPYAEEWQVAAALLSELTTLQDQLGTLNDSVVLAAAFRQTVREAAGEYAAMRLEAALADSEAASVGLSCHNDPVPGFLALAGFLRGQQNELYSHIRSASWPDYSETLMGRVRGIAMALEEEIE